MMVRSHLPGRLRIKGEELKSRVFLERIKSYLLNMKGVLKVEGNPGVGSLLVIYDENLLESNKLFEWLSLEKREAFKKYTFEERGLSLPSSLSRLKPINMGMLLGLLVSLAGLIFNHIGLHLWGGVVFLIFLSAHVYKYRNTLLWR
ncbi:MAG: hypothetical protein NZ850_09110 [Caldimicrobium sp.]|nr:hypothetical protein [Caldimicrobium sp.]